MDYDVYLEHIEQSKDIDIVYAGLVSLLPFFPLSLKLLERKNRGKKPFYDSFCYETKTKEIKEIQDSFLHVLEKKDVSMEGICEKLNGFVSILSEAESEIRNESLRKDFEYMIKEGKTMASLILQKGK